MKLIRPAEHELGSTSAHIFDEQAGRYGAWFDTPDGRILFENELPPFDCCGVKSFVQPWKPTSARDVSLRRWESSVALNRRRARCNWPNGAASE
jgi:hypothetical protein